MRKSYSTKNHTGPIEQRLYPASIQPPEEEMEAVQIVVDPVQALINKAKNATCGKKKLIEQARADRLRQMPKENTFMTGCGIYTEDYPTNEEAEPVMENNTQDLEGMLAQLLHKNDEDDLAELRRLIKHTSNNLNQYRKNTLKAVAALPSDIGIQMKGKIGRFK